MQNFKLGTFFSPLSASTESPGSSLGAMQPPAAPSGVTGAQRQTSSAKCSSSLILDSANAFLFLDRLDLSPIDKASPHTPKLKLSYTVAYNERKPSISIEYKRLVAEWRPFNR